jgi:hypothetical protein
MSAVAIAIALSVPIVLMDDSEVEKVIAGIPGIGDEINIFRSVAASPMLKHVIPNEHF